MGPRYRHVHPTDRDAALLPLADASFSRSILLAHDRTSIGAAIEYAVEQLGVREVIVCGHDGCGGVKAAFDGLPGIEPNSELAVWLHGLLPAVARARASDPDPRRQLRRAIEETFWRGSRTS